METSEESLKSVNNIVWYPSETWLLLLFLQVTQFLTQEARPSLKPYENQLNTAAKVNVWL